MTTLRTRPAPAAADRRPDGTGPAGRARRGAAWWVPAGVVALVATVLVTVTIATQDIALGEQWRSLATLRALGGPLGLEPLGALQDGMVWQLRLPRVLTAAAVGAGLAVCGVVMQSLTRNPLADPYLLGLSSGASLGAVLVLVAGWTVLLPVAAFGGAVLALSLRHSSEPTRQAVNSCGVCWG